MILDCIECFDQRLLAGKSLDLHLTDRRHHLLVIMWYDLLELWQISLKVLKNPLASL